VGESDSPIGTALLLGVNEFGLEILDVAVVEVEAAFERPIGDAPLALEQVEDLGQDVIIRHALSSTTRMPLSRRRGMKPG